MRGRIARVQSEGGASSAEYALLAAAIAAVIVLVVFALGNATRGSFTESCSSLEAEIKAGTTC